MSLCKDASQAVKSAQAANEKPKTGRADARQRQRMHRGTLPGDPITMTEMSRRIACLRRDTEFTERKALLQTIVDLDLGPLRRCGARQSLLVATAANRPSPHHAGFIGGAAG